MAIVKYIKGDILDTHCKYIAHGVNCQGKMGSGVAKAIYTRYPLVKKEYLHSCPKPKPELLGTFEIVVVDKNKRKYVFNCFTQENYGYDGKQYVSYGAIMSIFKELAGLQKSIAIPKIGCGLGGGDWDIVSTIIDECTKNGPDIYVYELEDKQWILKI